MRAAVATCVATLTTLFILLPLVCAPGCATPPDKVPGIFGREHLGDKSYITITFRNDNATEEVEVALLGEALLDPLPPLRRIPPGGTGSFTIPKPGALGGKGGATLSWKAADRGGCFTVGEEPLTIIIPSQPTPITIAENKQNEQLIEGLLKELKSFEQIIARPGEGAWKDEALGSLTEWAKKKKQMSGDLSSTTEPATGPASPEQETLYLAQVAMDLRATIANSFHRLGQYYEAKVMPIQAACCYVRALQLDCPQAAKSVAALLARQESDFLDNWGTYLKSDRVLSHDGKRMYFEHDFVPPGESGKLLGFTDKEMQYQIKVRLGQTRAFASLPPISKSVPYSENMMLDKWPNEIVLGALRMASDDRAGWPRWLWRGWVTMGVLHQARPIEQALREKEPARQDAAAATEPASQPAP